MNAGTGTEQSGKAVTTKTMFGRETSISTNIHAERATVWALLTAASGYPRWTSTVISLEGEIKEGEEIQLKSTLDAKRTFTLTVKEVEPERRLVWGDRQGSRTYTLTDDNEGGILFTMTEKIGGLFFPLYGRFIPSFDESFEQFAADLKREAEALSQ